MTNATGPTSGSTARRIEGGRLSLGPAVLDDLFPEGDAFRRSLQTYVSLLALAALIATFGLYQDSVASLIGAMLVAPLGGAIMALAGALVTGRSRWVWVCLLEVTLGGLLTIAVGYLVAAVLPNPLDLTPALEARTSPNLLDLGVALAAGAAGAYVAVRKTGIDALPGVAIAVSLVPPLATVGVCLQLERIVQAGGALLLFLTNFAAIVVVACLVFVVARATPSREDVRQRRQLKSGFALAVVVLALLAIPLGWNSADEIRSTVRAVQGAPVVREWIGDRDLEVVDWSIHGDQARIDLRGSDPPPDVADLAARIARVTGAPIRLEVTYTAVQRADASGAP